MPVHRSTQPPRRGISRMYRCLARLQARLSITSSPIGSSTKSLNALAISSNAKSSIRKPISSESDERESALPTIKISYPFWFRISIVSTSLSVRRAAQAVPSGTFSICVHWSETGSAAATRGFTAFPPSAVASWAFYEGVVRAYA